MFLRDFIVGMVIAKTVLASWPLSKAKVTAKIPTGPRNSQSLRAVIKAE